jgi:hypothetical protein
MGHSFLPSPFVSLIVWRKKEQLVRTPELCGFSVFAHFCKLRSIAKTVLYGIAEILMESSCVELWLIIWL